MRRFVASTLLALGLTGGVAAASPWHHDGGRGHTSYRDARVGAFNRGFERGRWGGERHEFRRDWRFEHRGRR
jgi:hypothetical protein